MIDFKEVARKFSSSNINLNNIALKMGLLDLKKFSEFKLQSSEFFHDYPYQEYYEAIACSSLLKSNPKALNINKLELEYVLNQRDFEDSMRYIVAKLNGETEKAESIKYQILEKVRRRRVNLTWKVDDITLTVGGTYEITDYSKETPQWHDYLKTIQRIIIEDGVEKISANAFIDCIHLEHIKIPESVKTIGDLAFTISYCGERTANGGRNVIWSLDDGTLVLKKNPTAQFDSDFSIGEITWRAIEKNIKQIKIECGVMPGNSFFEWLWQSERDVQLKLI